MSYQIEEKAERLTCDLNTRQIGDAANVLRQELQCDPREALAVIRIANQMKDYDSPDRIVVQNGNVFVRDDCTNTQIYAGSLYQGYGRDRDYRRNDDDGDRNGDWRYQNRNDDWRYQNRNDDWRYQNRNDDWRYQNRNDDWRYQNRNDDWRYQNRNDDWRYQNRNDDWRYQNRNDDWRYQNQNDNWRYENRSDDWRYQNSRPYQNGTYGDYRGERDGDDYQRYPQVYRRPSVYISSEYPDYGRSSGRDLGTGIAIGVVGGLILDQALNHRRNYSRGDW